MNRKYLNTAVAVAVLVVAWFGLILWDRHKSNELAKTVPKVPAKIVPIDSSHIQSFTLTPRAEPGFTCRKVGGKWVLEPQPNPLATSQKAAEPETLPADQSARLAGSPGHADVKCFRWKRRYSR